MSVQSVQFAGRNLSKFLINVSHLLLSPPCTMSDPMKVVVPQIENLFKIDPYLKAHERELRRR